ncbi:Retrovirus-related Pol polyprotein from transposon TNT 1-94 [Cardamine amara subsp. amara]|uniref:Retrovirus-related Pol polyprotein from transposon TNT 1-94 n=1 Tax=Cardamine amara subsp. amara TaxID=228776 RepID=A0ABD1AJM0_CARAN
MAIEEKHHMVLTASLHNTKHEWVLDYGYRFYITPDKEVLFDLEEIDGGKVLMGNDTHSEVKGIGKLRILNPNGTTVTLIEVRYMPTIGINLISYGQFDKNGCNYIGEDFKVTFYKQGKKVIAGKCQDGLYYLDGIVL